MNNVSSNFFPSRPLDFEKMGADDVVCSSLGVSSAQVWECHLLKSRSVVCSSLGVSSAQVWECRLLKSGSVGVSSAQVWECRLLNLVTYLETNLKKHCSDC
jgi:hypothetical protein